MSRVTVIARQTFYDSKNKTKRVKGEKFTLLSNQFDSLPRKLVDIFEEKPEPKKKAGRPKKKEEKKEYKTKEEKLNLDDKQS